MLTEIGWPISDNNKKIKQKRVPSGMVSKVSKQATYYEWEQKITKNKSYSLYGLSIEKVKVNVKTKP